MGKMARERALDTGKGVWRMDGRRSVKLEGRLGLFVDRGMGGYVLVARQPGVEEKGGKDNTATWTGANGEGPGLGTGGGRGHMDRSQ
jgi:hypothetical protein